MPRTDRRTERAVWQVRYSALIAVFAASNVERILTRATISGPVGSVFQLCAGAINPDSVLTQTAWGESNSWPKAGETVERIVLPKNVDILGVWTDGLSSTGTGELALWWEW